MRLRRPLLPAMILSLAGCATVSSQPPFETVEIERVPGGIFGGPAKYKVEVFHTGVVKVSEENIYLKLPGDGGTSEKETVARTATVTASKARLNKFIGILEAYRPQATGKVTETCERTPLSSLEIEEPPNTRREVDLSDWPVVVSRVPVWTVRWKGKGYDARLEACQHQRGHEAVDSIFSALRVLGLPSWANRWFLMGRQ